MVTSDQLQSGPSFSLSQFGLIITKSQGSVLETWLLPVMLHQGLASLGDSDIGIWILVSLIARSSFDLHAGRFLSFYSCSADAEHPSYSSEMLFVFLLIINVSAIAIPNVFTQTRSATIDLALPAIPNWTLVKTAVLPSNPLVNFERSELDSVAVGLGVSGPGLGSKSLHLRYSIDLIHSSPCIHAEIRDSILPTDTTATDGGMIISLSNVTYRLRFHLGRLNSTYTLPL